MTLPSSSRRLPYIDGLRAIAILAVFVYHLAPTVVPNGYLGVDVFFVVSGFVVCRALLATSARGDLGLFAWLERFYRRRFWRLAPALVAMVFVTQLFVILFVPPGFLSRLIFFTGAGAASGVANVVLVLSSGANYFAEMSKFNPFLHAWSLGVEEQFYLVFPLLLWAVWVKVHGSRLARAALPMLVLVSFMLAVWQSESAPTHAFYLLPFRFWELGAGVLAFLGFDRARGWIGHTEARSIIAWIGLAAIGASFFVPTVSSPFPGGVLPVVGTVLVLLYGGDDGRGSPNRWLSLGAAVYIGKISYSLYLWHWPVIVLMRWTVGAEQLSQILVAAAVSITLAVLSFHFVEQRAQRSARAGRALVPRDLVAAAALIAAFPVAVLLVGYNRGYDAIHRSALLSGASKEFGWKTAELPGLGVQTRDDLWHRRPALFVLGDSHAEHLDGVATAAARDAGLGLVVASHTCEFTLLTPLTEQGERVCHATLDNVRSGDIVLFSSRNVPVLVDFDGTVMPEPDFEDPQATAKREQAREQFAAAVRKLVARGVDVVTRTPAPSFQFPAFRCSDWFNRSNPVCAVPTTEQRERLIARGQPAADSIAAIKREIPEMRVWEVFDELCPGEQCSVYDERGNVIFYDQDHLTGWGNALLLPSLRHTLHRSVPSSEMP